MTAPDNTAPDNTAPDNTAPDNTSKPGPDVTGDTTAEQSTVSGGSADRLDPAGDGTGGVPAAGADGVTEAREELRKDLGERPADAGTEGGADLDQSAAIGSTDDPQGGSIQQDGSRA